MANPEAGIPIQEAEQLERAKNGVSRFVEIYASADPAIQRVLLTEKTGREIQALFLGIKPMAEFHTIEDPNNARVADYVSQHAWYLSERDRLIDLQQARAVITANPDIFPDPALDDASIRSYLRSFQAEVDNEPRKVGLLFGFPRQAVLQFVEHQRRVNEVTLFIEEFYHEDEPIKHDLLNPDIGANQFRDKHQEELRKLLALHFKYASQDEIDYILTARLVNIPGFTYIASGPDPLNSPHVQMVRKLFEESGMSAFVRSQIISEE